jgi:hypothetical protein
MSIGVPDVPPEAVAEYIPPDLLALREEVDALIEVGSILPSDSSLCIANKMLGGLTYSGWELDKATPTQNMPRYRRNLGIYQFLYSRGRPSIDYDTEIYITDEAVIQTSEKKVQRALFPVIRKLFVFSLTSTGAMKSNFFDVQIGGYNSTGTFMAAMPLPDENEEAWREGSKFEKDVSEWNPGRTGEVRTIVNRMSSFISALTGE